MTLFDIFLLGLALSVDAFIVSFSYGLVLKPHRMSNGLKLGAATGFFQFLMPVIGWYGARSINRYIESIDHWLAFFVFLALGVKIINDALYEEAEEKQPLQKKLTLQALFMIGIATSIDALVTGATIYFMQTPIWLSAVIIGCTTFACAAFGYGLCRVLKRFSTKYLEVAAGIILIALGCKVLFEYLSA